MESLEVLDVSQNKIDKIASQGITFLMENATSLNYVDFTAMNLTPGSNTSTKLLTKSEATFIILSSISLNSKLGNIEVDISENNLGEEGASSLAR